MLEDLDGDGVLDLAVASRDAGDVSLLFNDGTGDFSDAAHRKVGLASAIVGGDFDKDGMCDLAVADRGGAAVLLLLATCSP